MEPLALSGAYAPALLLRIEIEVIHPCEGVAESVARLALGAVAGRAQDVAPVLSRGYGRGRHGLTGRRRRQRGTGQILIGLATRMTKILGSFSTGTNPGSIVDGNLVALPGSMGFFTTLPPLGNAGLDTPSIVISGATISWSWK